MSTRTTTSPETIYFAYGSNLDLTQLLHRCPSMRYLGRATLPNFKWQINSLGHANVIPSLGDHVEGLCFLLCDHVDEDVLDGYEGVPNTYEKHYIGVDIFAAGPLIVGRKVGEVRERLVVERSLDLRRLDEGVERAREKDRHSVVGEVVQVLVYLSRTATGDGKPRREYVERIRCGVQDAMALGIRREYFEKYFLGPMGWEKSLLVGLENAGVAGER